MKKTIITIFAAVAILGACNSSGDANKTHEHTSTEMKADSTATAVCYQCPMDCEKGKTYEKPGKCPVCNMDLQEVKK